MNIRWAWNILWAKAFVVATDKRAYMHIPMNLPNTFTTITMLAAQRNALETFKQNIEEAIKEHDEVTSEKFN